jgi:hypothetical protein
MQKTPCIVQVAPCLPKEFVMGIGHIVYVDGGVFIAHGEILDSLKERVKI